jgi:hypothetical protein
MSTEVVGGVAMTRCACGTSIVSIEAPLARYRSTMHHQQGAEHRRWRERGGLEQPSFPVYVQVEEKAA